MLDKEILDIDEISSFLRIPKGTVYKMCERGKIPYFKAGKRIRFRKRVIDKWIERQERQKPRKKPSAATKGTDKVQPKRRINNNPGIAVDNTSPQTAPFAKQDTDLSKKNSIIVDATYSSVERRNTPRLDAEFVVRFKDKSTGRTLNINETGACISSTKTLNAKKSPVTIVLPTTPVEIEVNPVWARKDDNDSSVLQGVRFVNPREEIFGGRS